jgi:hypothetical protein
MNKLNKSNIPIFRFFSRGEAAIVINAYIDKMNIMQAITVLIIILIIIGVENTDGSLDKNNNKTNIDKINIGWINPMIADLLNPICVVLHNTKVLKPYTITQPNNKKLKYKSVFNMADNIPPQIKTKQIKIIESIDKNIECFIFRLIPWRTFTPY